MIEGFKLKVGTKELREHCLARSAYHARRGDEKQKELPQLRQTLETFKSSKPSGLSNMGGKNAAMYDLDPDDAVKEAERDIQTHYNKSLVFSYFAEHLFQDDYILNEHDLVRLEILNNQHGERLR